MRIAETQNGFTLEIENEYDNKTDLIQNNDMFMSDFYFIPDNTNGSLCLINYRTGNVYLNDIYTNDCFLKQFNGTNTLELTAIGTIDDYANNGFITV